MIEIVGRIVNGSMVTIEGNGVSYEVKINGMTVKTTKDIFMAKKEYRAIIGGML